MAPQSEALADDETESTERLPVPMGDETLHLHLRRYRADAAGKPAVLMLHGGNSSSQTFVVPNGGIAKYLYTQGKDVWLLDWRGSPFVQAELAQRFADRHIGGTLFKECQYFTCDRAANEDLRAGIKAVQKRTAAPVSVLGHCLAGGVTAIGIANGVLSALNVKRAVLVALGLFVEVPWDSWVKVEDYLLERIFTEESPSRGVDPTNVPSWPHVMAEAYRAWPCPWFAKEPGATSDLLRRMTFMIGKPWSPELLSPRLGYDILKPIFGPLHLGLYLHSGQMVRRGFAAPFDGVDLIDRHRLSKTSRHRARLAARLPNPDFLLPKHFLNMDKVTLVTGAENRVWHRDSMDLMYEWLKRLDAKPGRFVKHIVPDFGLQDLFWSRDAETDAWRAIADGL